jgi:hypothetical protein
VTSAGTSGSPSPVPGPSLEPLVTLGADAPVLTDTFDDPTQWPTVESIDGTVAYGQGTLEVAIVADGKSLWTARTIAEPAVVLGVLGHLTLAEGQGGAGLMCGSGPVGNDFLFVVVDDTSTWRVGEMTGGTTRTLGRGPLPAGVDLSSGGSLSLAIECAMVGTASNRVAVWIDGETVADVRTAAQLGPFHRAALYAEARRAPFVATYDDVAVSAGDSYAPVALPPAAADLLRHVPVAYRAACTPTESTPGAGVEAGVVCSPAGAVDQVEYYQYDGRDAMDAAYESLVAAAGELPGQDCSVGPSEVQWAVDGDGSGQMACFPRAATGASPVPGDLVMMWTHEPLHVLSIGTAIGTTYADLYSWWLDSGPMP